MRKRTLIKKIKLKPWVRMSILATVFVIFFTGIHVIYSGFRLQQNKAQAEVLYNYNIYQNATYKVFLNKNSFIDKEFLPMGETYISDLVKNIEIDYSFQYSGSKKIPLTISSSINGEIHGEYSNSQDVDKTQVWTKQYTLKEEEKRNLEDDPGTLFNGHLTIDFNKYNQEVIQFRRELGLPITAYLKLDIHFHIEGTVEEEFKADKSIVLNIPLNQQAFSIEEDYENEYKENIYEKKVYVGSINSRNLVCGILLIINAIFVLVIFFKEIFDIKKKTAFNLELKKILKTYGDIVVEVEERIETDNYSLVRVKNFNELVDLEEELRNPIIYYEIEPDYHGIFMIIHGDICYYFELSNDDL